MYLKNNPFHKLGKLQAKLFTIMNGRFAKAGVW